MPSEWRQDRQCKYIPPAAAIALTVRQFDDLSKGSNVQNVYKDFRFNQNSFMVTSGSDFPAGSQGRLASVSAPNAAKSIPNFFVHPEFTSIVTPVQATLINLESITITLDIAPTNFTALAALRLHVTVHDACGATSRLLGVDRYSLMPSVYFLQTRLGKSQITFTYPFFAISRIIINVSYIYGTGFENEASPAFWIDDLMYRTYEGKIPGCTRCGFRGSGHCEVPLITR